MYVQLPGTPPRHSDVDDRAEEEENNELEQAAFHDSILRRWLSAPAAFGTTDGEVTAQVVATCLTVSRRKSPVMFERPDRRPSNTQKRYPKWNKEVRCSRGYESAADELGQPICLVGLPRCEPSLRWHALGVHGYFKASDAQIDNYGWGLVAERRPERADPTKQKEHTCGHPDPFDIPSLWFHFANNLEMISSRRPRPWSVCSFPSRSMTK